MFAKKIFKKLTAALFCAAMMCAAVCLVSCDDDDDDDTPVGKTFTVTFDSNAPENLPDGVSVQGYMPNQFIERAEGGAASGAQKLNKCAFTLTGYVFRGWARAANLPEIYDDCGSISIYDTDNITLYAVWGEAIAVTFNKDSDEATGEMQAMTVAKGKRVALTKCAFERTGYIFKGWATSPSSQESASNVKYYEDEERAGFYEDTTLYAVWGAKKCKASFDKNGAASGEVTDEAEYAYGGKFSFPNPENAFVYDADHVFAGWAISAKPTNADKIYSADEKVVWHWDGDQTFYAVWRDKNANPLKANGSEIGDAGSFVFDTTAATDFVFTGELFAEDFKKILDATKVLATVVNLDFSDCEGVPFTLKDGTLPHPVVDSSAKIKSLVLPSNLSRVPEWFFYENSYLTSVEVGGKTETIGYSAFDLCRRLEKIKLNEGVKTIENGAFSFAIAITNIDIPASVETLASNEFSSCDRLAAINVAEGNQNYSSADGVLFDKGKTKLLIYPQRKATRFYSVPSTVTEISDRAFKYNSNLIGIEIPSSVTKISEFYDCDRLAAINVAEGNQNYSSTDGVLFDKGKTKLLVYPRGKTTSAYSVPSTVTEIYDFSGNTNLQSVNIPASVKSISGGCFSINNSSSSPAKFSSITVDDGNANYSAENGVLYNKDKTLLIRYPCAKTDTSFAIPATVTEIKSNAFKYATNLAKVHIPQSVQTIKTSDTRYYAYQYSPFSNCSSSLKIYCEPASKPTGFGYSWNAYDYNYSTGDKTLAVEYGVSAAAFAAK